MSDPIESPTRNALELGCASALRASVRATYDSRETGDRYHVTTSINDKTVSFQKRVPDPFVRTTVTVGLRDALAALLRLRPVKVEVVVGGDVEVMNDVLELDDNTLIPGRTRKAAFQQSMHGKLAAFGDGERSHG